MANLCFSVLRYFLEPEKDGSLPIKDLLPPKNLSPVVVVCCPVNAAALPLKWHAAEGGRPFESLCHVKGKLLKDKGIYLYEG